MSDDRQRLIAQIHIAKSQLGIADEAYRAMLTRLTGKTSSRELTVWQLRAVITELKAKGFQAKPGRTPRPRPAPDRAALMGKIEAFLAEAGRPSGYADGMARNMFKVDRVEWCDADQLHRIVAALTYDAKRHGRRTQ